MIGTVFILLKNFTFRYIITDIILNVLLGKDRIMPKNSKLSCSFVTQEKIAKSLKELMRTKQFEKISVYDIVKNCDIHRQTFYYHFEDKYELLDWIIEKELVEPFMKNFSLDNVYDRFEELFSSMEKNRYFYQNALKINVAVLSRYLGKLANVQVVSLINSVKEQNGIVDDNTDVLLSAEFVSCGMAGIVLSWVEGGMKEPSSVMAQRIKEIISSVKKLAEERK